MEPGVFSQIVRLPELTITSIPYGRIGLQRKFRRVGFEPLIGDIKSMCMSYKTRHCLRTNADTGVHLVAFANWEGIDNTQWTKLSPALRVASKLLLESFVLRLFDNVLHGEIVEDGLQGYFLPIDDWQTVGMIRQQRNGARTDYCPG
jgi:hypothetical protein